MTLCVLRADLADGYGGGGFNNLLLVEGIFGWMGHLVVWYIVLS